MLKRLLVVWFALLCPGAESLICYNCTDCADPKPNKSWKQVTCQMPERVCAKIVWYDRTDRGCVPGYRCLRPTQADVNSGLIACYACYDLELCNAAIRPTPGNPRHVLVLALLVLIVTL